ncbi:MAG TPA: lipopolysaccharide assembly protein LapA domain-containing protein [Acidimicrobiales bacterium]|jgi:uncharacterized integral membrane protein|nr:lipopolysaccharide assembly protein LapA domain-containing protein [Acidimicrobiales bacterium]
MSESEDQDQDVGASPSPPSSPVDESQTDHRHLSQAGREHFRHTRTSAAWVGIVVAIIFGVALIDFIAQNTRDVRIDFFSVSGRMPVAVALLVAALAGAIVVVAVGVGRVAQLRLTMRRQRRQHDAEREAKN